MSIHPCAQGAHGHLLRGDDVHNRALSSVGVHLNTTQNALAHHLKQLILVLQGRVHIMYKTKCTLQSTLLIEIVAITCMCTVHDIFRAEHTK